nr:hypothetical protein [Tanacetum cinerariifolium]
MPTLAKFMILSGADNRPPMLEKHLVPRIYEQEFNYLCKDGRVTIQPVQGRQSSFVAGTSGTRANISGIGRNNSGQQRVVKCFNLLGEGHMARQSPKPKRKRDATWFRDKVLLVKAQGYGKVLNEEELEFLVDLEVQKVQLHRQSLHTMQLIKQMISIRMILTVTTSLQPRQFLWPICLITD